MKNTAYIILSLSLSAVLFGFNNHKYPSVDSLTPEPQVECTKITDTIFDKNGVISKINIYQSKNNGKTSISILERPENNYIRTTIVKYDDNGNRTEILRVTKTGNQISESLITYSYNEAGKLLSEITYYNGELFWQYNYTYYPNDVLKSKAHVRHDGSFLSYTYNKLGADGKIIKTKHIDNPYAPVRGRYYKMYYSDSLITKREYYEDFSLITSTISEYVDGKISTETTYNSNGDITFIKKSTYQNDTLSSFLGLANGTDTSYYMTYKYDAMSNLLEFTYMDQQNSFMHEYDNTYDVNGNLIKSIMYIDGQIETTTTYGYDCQ